LSRSAKPLIRAAQVKALEANYPGGVRAYVNNAQSLLKSSAAGDNPFDGMRPEVRLGCPVGSVDR
jgi:hypothetical protein